ncbi:MAG: ParB/RepB/Spo0J family partition protein [Acidobacteria bacterium]|nr:ParB/RepB/Spo0J family partition protein [Acidobacteriota bacterium]
MNEFQSIPIDNLAESTRNPRRRFSETQMEELTKSVRRHGVLVPILARPVNGHYEIIAGARRYRAAKAAGLKELPARIKEIGDVEALEISILENLQREDVHPLEEAVGFKTLHELSGYEVASIAAKVGRSESYVYQRLKLIDLIQPVQDAFIEDRITAAHAILIARLQPQDQEQAFEACFLDQYGLPQKGEEKHARSVRQLSNWIQENVHLDLNGAPFKKDDPELVPAAGACTTCPKRTGYLPQLFPDIAKKDTCTDRKCFEEKLQAHIKLRKAQLQAKGVHPLEVSVDYHLEPREEKADLLPASRYHEIQGKKDRCRSVQKAIVVSGYRDRGKTVDVCADPQCRKHGSLIRSDASDGRSKRLQDRHEELRQRKRTARIRILEAVIEKAKSPLTRPELETVAIGFWNDLWSELQKAVISRRKWEKKQCRGGHGVDYDTIIRKHIPNLTDDELAGLLLELAVCRQLDGIDGARQKDRLAELAKHHGIDIKAIEKAVVAEFSAKKKAKAKKPAGGKKAAAPAAHFNRRKRRS